MDKTYRKSHINLLSRLIIIIGCLFSGLSIATPHEETGGIYVRTDPLRAEVSLNGKVIGASPCTATDIKPGEITVNAMRSGFADAEKTVTVEAGKITTVQLHLDPLGKGIGNLLVLIEPPGAAVTLDSERVGVTPQRISNLDAGTYELEVSKPGYKPFSDTVRVDPGHYHEIVVKLPEDPDASESATPAKPAVEADTGGDISDPKTVDFDNFTEEPAQFWESFRGYLNNRKYSSALTKLEEISENIKDSSHLMALEKEKQHLHTARKILEAGRNALKRREGEQYPLPLKRGGSFTGELTQVGDEYVEIDIGRTTRRLKWDDIHIERIIRLAASKYPPPRHRMSIAYLYIAESDFDKAEKEIQHAKRDGDDPAYIENILDRERRAYQKATGDDEEVILSQEEDEEEAAEEVGKKGLRIIVDEHFGRPLPRRLNETIERFDYDLASINTPFDEEDAQNCTIYILLSGRNLSRPLTDDYILNLTTYLKEGGGVIIFGAPFNQRSKMQNLTIHPLLERFNLDLISDELIVSQMAPDEHRSNILPANPINQHPITTAMSGYIPFPIDTPILVTDTPLLKGSRYVMARQEGISQIPLLSAGAVEDGKIAVFAGMPAINDARQGENAVNLVLNTIRWITLE